MSRRIEFNRTVAIPKIGRPKKFETVEQLQQMIDSYFNSCFMQRRERIKVKNEEDDGYEYVDSLVTDRDGNPVYEQIRPFTITGLAISLGTTRETLLDYENKPENAEFSDTIKEAKQVIQNYADEFLFNGQNATGAIFSLKNNWGWVDRTETDLTTKGDKIQAGVIESKAADILEEDENQ